MGQRIPVTLGNIAPLSLRPFQPGRIALVCEGGGQRGIFTAGVLDEFMRAQFNPFDLYPVSYTHLDVYKRQLQG